MKGLKKYAINRDLFSSFPVNFKFIHYWNFAEEPGRIDNFDDPYFDGIRSDKYQTDCFLPLGHHKPISKIVDWKVFSKPKDGQR